MLTEKIEKLVQTHEQCNKFFNSKKIEQYKLLPEGKFKNFIDEIIRNFNEKHVSRRRWSSEIKSTCLSINFHSPKCYDFIRTFLPLPSPVTLKAPMNNLNIKPGFCDDAIHILKSAVQTFSDIDKYCVLTFDEMSLKAGLDYNEKYDIIEGFETLGKNEASKKETLEKKETSKKKTLGKKKTSKKETSQKNGNEGFVFMVRGMFTNWKQPISYFISNNGMKATDLMNLLTSALELLKEIGLKVKVVVCDMATVNQSLFKKYLHISVEKPFFKHKDDTYFAMFDPLHLLKCLRNSLKKHDFEINGHIITWKYIIKLFELEASRNIGLRLAPKLQLKHVTLPPFSKMKVKPAAIVLAIQQHQLFKLTFHLVICQLMLYILQTFYEILTNCSILLIAAN